MDRLRTGFSSRRLTIRHPVMDNPRDMQHAMLQGGGLLSRWLEVESLDELCRETYHTFHGAFGIDRLLIVASRGGRRSKWAMAPDDDNSLAVQEWFESGGRERGVHRPAATPRVPEISHTVAGPLARLGIDSVCRMLESSGVSYDVFWAASDQTKATETVACIEECCREHGPLWCALELALSNLARFQRVREQSHIDLLTGTFNRRHFNVRLTEEVDRARRFDRPLSLLVADLDNFKLLNDARGHQVGDVVLRYAGQTIRHSVRSIDVLCRLGGDEFAILMPDTDAEHSAVLAERLCRAVADREFSVGGMGRPVRLKLSLGAAIYPTDAERPERLLWCADMALLEAKRRNGNQVVFYDASYCGSLHMPLRVPADDAESPVDGTGAR